MNYKAYFYFFLLLPFMAGCATQGNRTASTQDSEGDKRPNIVVIMADDLGYSDLGCFGGEVETPSLDKLAGEGVRFTQFYNTSRCCPTRASFLTGLYPHQAGIGRMTMDAGQPGYRGYLTENTVTVAEVLKGAGYHTGMVGKWHVSPTERREKDEQLAWLAHQKDLGDFSDKSTYPTARGFEKYYGNIWGVVDYFDPFSLMNGDEKVESVPEGYYHTNAIGDSAVAYVDEFAKDDKPFFLYVAHCAPHWPLQALPEDIKKYESVYKIGWDSIRVKRYERMQQLGLISKENAEFSPRMFPKLDWETNPNKEWDAHAMAVHAAMIDRMDQTIGKLMDKLEETGEMDNTIILFLSDNGASYERPSKYGPGFDRAGSTRQGEEVKFPVDKSTDAMPGPQTVHAGIGPVWANVANTPFRYYKSKVFEGGIRTPMIMHWPKGITKQGGFEKQTGHVADLMATFVELAGTAYPTQLNGHNITPTVGTSLVPAIKGTGEVQRNTLFWEHFGSKAIRQGDWKLVMLDKKSDWELYNLAEDQTEMHNLAAKHPEKVEELAALWEQQAQAYQVYPMPQ
ncbi:arylsulfatase [Limibacter armeniacum]|uniref:arylsulfatase n=1 Tax=Limibacter armeniacum TaxID=466084 RepID=UPI002FE518A2